MYSKLPNLVIGFHGCDIGTFKKVIHEQKPIKKSMNDYDWLGNGIYFWEQSYHRALDWAKASDKIETPAVIGAVIDLGYCLNLMDYHSAEILKRGYQMLKIKCELADRELPKNRNSGDNTDLLLRDLDCAVIQQIHTFNQEAKRLQYDSVRGAFIEGKPIYAGSGFKEKTHIQLCIVNPNCIKGYFSPLVYNPSYSLP